jgi:mutator protein MutT
VRLSVSEIPLERYATFRIKARLNPCRLRMVIKECAALLFYNDKGEILLMQRTLDAPKNPGKWSFFGGSLEEGETPLMALIREAKEELDIDIQEPKLLFISDHEYVGHVDRMHVFVKEYSENLRLDQKEGRARAWYNIKDALKLDLSPDVRTALEHLDKRNISII